MLVLAFLVFNSLRSGRMTSNLASAAGWALSQTSCGCAADHAPGLSAEAAGVPCDRDAEERQWPLRRQHRRGPALVDD